MSTMLTLVEENEDLFDRLPDSIILTIFDKLQDAKSLSISSSLCKRFHFLTSQTHHISLTIPPHKKTPNNKKSQFIRFLNKFGVFLKPFKFVLQQINKWNLPIHKNDRHTNSCCVCSFASPIEILRSFTEIKQLEIRLPGGGENVGDFDSLLKWKAEFGTQLKNCLIVGGTSLSSSSSPIIRNDQCDGAEDALNSQHRMTNDELKLRIVWIISSLIAASARHSLLEETVREKRTLESVVITDDIGQGKCCTKGEQVEEMRRNYTGAFSTKIPSLKVKMWYVPELELQEGGCVMKGATLVVIKPVEEWSNKADDGGDLVAKGLGFGGFGETTGDGKEEEKVFDEVARELVKLERSYSLEMNSF